MSLAEIIQIIIGILSLIATIVVSFSIYWLQARHEKEIRKIEEKQKQRELEERAEAFLFDNEDEREYLLQCVIANSMHRHEKHVRKIYTNFCRCSEELQNEILKQAGFSIKLIFDKDWVDTCFQALENDVERLKLGMNVLYEGEKYFHRGFERYRKEKWDIEYKAFFQPIYKSRWFFGKNNLVDIGYYIGDYFYYIVDSRIDKEAIPPIDYVWESQDLGHCDEVLVCKWVMALVKYIAINIHNRTKERDDIWEQAPVGVESETLEDEYYKVMYIMYATYYVPQVLEKHQKVRRRRWKKENVLGESDKHKIRR